MRLSKSAEPRSPNEPLPIAVTMGDPAGIGGELTIKSWNVRRQHELPRYFVIDDPDRLLALAASIGIDLPIQKIDRPEKASHVFDQALPVLPLTNYVEKSSAKVTIESIDLAVKLAMAGRVKAVVTNPITKKSLYNEGFSFQGHTDYLEHLATQATGKKSKTVMMLSCNKLRTVPLTVHIPLASVPASITRPLIIETAHVVARSLEAQFAIDRPKLVVAGLNPHAGEEGSLGVEDQNVLLPAIETLKEQGIDIRGPFPADTLFHEKARQTYDAALCMYHDQALIPIKTIDFDRGVNVTLGLPFVRTSPDHGTAHDIAGTGIANTTSFIEALRLADQISTQKSRNTATSTPRA